MKLLRPFVPVLVLPLVITVAALAGVAWNRSGGRGPLTLSEREVHVVQPGDENTTAWLWLQWEAPRRVFAERGDRELRQGFVALELREEAAGRSRLVVVEVAADAATLERRYPDGRTHLIAAATLSVPDDGDYADGFVIALQPQRIHVPRQSAARLRGSFDVELWSGLRYEPWITAIRPR